MHHLPKFLAASATLCLALPVLAEGGDKRPGGAYGVNRRVISQENFVEVSGKFQMDFGLPYGIVTGSSQPVPVVGPYVDQPSIYLGAKVDGGSYETDFGLQYNQADASRAPVTPDKAQGWYYFLRATVPAKAATATEPALPALSQLDGIRHLRWYKSATDKAATWGSGSTNTLSTTMRLKVHEGDTPSTSLKEKIGWVSLTVDQIPALNGPHTVYFLRPATTNSTTTVGNSLKVGTTVNATTGDGPSQVTLNSVAGFEKNVSVKIGADTRVVTNIIPSSNTLVLNLPLRSAHAFGEAVTQDLNGATPYEGHPVAPWVGEDIFSTQLPANASSPSPIRVKRVIAMTRQGGENKPSFTTELDGSWLSCTTTEGAVRRRGTASMVAWSHTESTTSPPPTTPPTPARFADTAGAVWQGKEETLELGSTGYDAKSNPTASTPAADLVEHLDQVWQRPISKMPNSVLNSIATSKTRVEFPRLHITGINTGSYSKPEDQEAANAAANSKGRENTVLSRASRQKITDTVAVSRYTSETVNINLRTAAGLEGNDLTIASR